MTPTALESIAARAERGNWAAARAVDHSPDSTLTLLRRLRTFGGDVCFREIVLRLLENSGTSDAVLTECAKQLYSLGDFGLALHCADAAVAKAQEDLQARL